MDAMSSNGWESSWKQGWKSDNTGKKNPGEIGNETSRDSTTNESGNQGNNRTASPPPTLQALKPPPGSARQLLRAISHGDRSAMHDELRDGAVLNNLHLYTAVLNGHQEIAAELLALQAPVSKGELIAAAENADSAMLALLWDAGAPVAENIFLYSLRQPRSVEFFIEKGLLPDSKDLCRAIMQDQYETVELLLKKLAPVASAELIPAIDRALFRNDVQMLGLLLQYSVRFEDRQIMAMRHSASSAIRLAWHEYFVEGRADCMAEQSTAVEPAMDGAVFGPRDSPQNRLPGKDQAMRRILDAEARYPRKYSEPLLKDRS